MAEICLQCKKCETWVPKTLWIPNKGLCPRCKKKEDSNA